MFHIYDRQIKANPLTYLLGKAAGRINQVLANNRAFVCNDFPLAAVQQARAGNLGVAVNLGATHTGAGGHRISCTGRICMAVIGSVEPHLYIIHDQQGVQFTNLRRAYQMAFTANRIQYALDVIKPVDFRVGQCKANGTTSVPTCRLASLGLQGLVQSWPLLVEFGHAKPTNEVGYQAGRMPS